MSTRFKPILKSATKAATKVVKNATKNALKETGKDIMTSYLKGQLTPSPTFIRTPSPTFSGSPVTPMAYSLPSFSSSAFSRPMQYPAPCVCTVSNNAPKVNNKSVLVCNYCGSSAKTPVEVAVNLQEFTSLHPLKPIPISSQFSNTLKKGIHSNNEELTNESFYGGRRTRRRLGSRRKSRNRH